MSNWIAKATSKHKGSFKKKAKAAGMTTLGFAARTLKKGSKASRVTKRQASLARTLMGFRKKG